MSKPSTYFSKQQGFSLLEALVAFAILVMVLAVTMQILGSSSRSSKLSHEYAVATLVAKSKLAEVQLLMTDKDSGVEQEKYHWSIQREKANYDDVGMDKNYRQSFTMYDVTVTVSWKSAGKRHHIDIKTVQLENNK